MRQAEYSNKVVVETRNKYTQPQIFNYIGAGLGFGILIDIIFIPLLMLNTKYMKFINVIDLPLSIAVFVFYAIYKRLVLNGVIPAYFRNYSKFDYFLATVVSIISFSSFFRIVFFTFAKLFLSFANKYEVTISTYAVDMFFANILNPFIFVFAAFGFIAFVYYLFYSRKDWNIEEASRMEALNIQKKRNEMIGVNTVSNAEIRVKMILEKERRQEELRKKYAAMNLAKPVQTVENSVEKSVGITQEIKKYNKGEYTTFASKRRINKGVVRRGRE